jgi:hypothetical protein
MTADFTMWNALVSTLTLIVVATAAIAAFRQLRHIRGQTSLAGLLKVQGDWRDPEFQALLTYVRSELPAKIAEPGFLDDLDSSPIDRVKHRELEICDWYEQMGSYLKYGLIDEDVVMDVSSSSCNAAWAAIEPVIARMRRTRGDSLYENFEYMAARGVLFQRAHPTGTYPKDTPRMSAFSGAVTYGVTMASAAAPALAEPGRSAEV